MLAAKAVFAYLGILIVAALYYVLLETHVTLPFLRETNTQAWHHLVPRAGLRHDIRDVGEGLLGGLLGIAFTYNHFRVRPRKNLIDRVEIALGIPNVKDERKLVWWQVNRSARRRPPRSWQVILGVVLIPVYACVGFFIGEAVVNAIHPYVNHAVETETGNLVFNIKANVIETGRRR